MSGINIKSFIKDNGEKKVTIRAYIYSFYYRLMVRFAPMSKIRPKLGIEKLESPVEESIDNQKIAKLYAFHVNRITEHLPWEAKCLVRALTLKKLLSEKRISSTIYLGIKKEENKMVAHAWLRSGLLFLTGGTGKGYTVVGKYGNVF